VSYIPLERGVYSACEFNVFHPVSTLDVKRYRKDSNLHITG